MPKRCEENAKKGTGSGTCGRPLDRYEQCDRAASHLTECMSERYRPGGAPRISAAAEQRWNERLDAERQRDALLWQAIWALQNGDVQLSAELEAEAKSIIIPDYL